MEGWECVRFGERPSVIVHVPHAGTDIPDAVRAGIRLDDASLAAELAAMTDWHTDLIALDACRRSGVSSVVFRNRLSRLVVDPERLPDDREPMARVGMGAVYTKTSGGAPLRLPDAELRRRYFDPYSAALADVVDELLTESATVTIIDLHSFPRRPLTYERDHDAHRPGVCLGTDPFHTSESLLRTARVAFAGVDGGVDRNTPFAGTYVPLRHFQIDVRVHSIMIEIRRDVYLDEATHETHAGFANVVDRFASLITSIT